VPSPPEEQAQPDAATEEPSGTERFSMIKTIRQAGNYDQWFTESAAAIEHNGEDWVTAREMVNDFEALGFELDGKPIADLSPDRRDQFLKLLHTALALFARGKLLRTQPKAVYTSSLRIRGFDEPSYQLSNFGAKLLHGNTLLRRSYVTCLAVSLWLFGVLKRYKWVITVISVTAAVLRLFEVIQSTVAAITIALFMIIVTVIVRSVFSSLN
jgi:hypothetical protein